MEFWQSIKHWIMVQGGEPLKLGNVEFSIQGFDLVYDIPTNKWDQQSLTADMTAMANKFGIYPLAR